MASRIRFPIFTKILMSCLLLAGMMIVLSYAWARYQAGRHGRGRYLDAYIKRYAAYQQGMGQALSSVADIIATDAALRVALSPPSPASLAAATLFGDDDGATGAKDAQIAARARAAERAREIAEQLSGKQSLQPAIFIVFDQYGDAVYVPERSPIGGNELRELEAISKVRKGDVFFNELVLHGGKVYQTSGVNIRAWDGKATVGGVLLGVPIERHFDAFKKQSDETERDQLRLSLILNNEVLGSVFPPETWSELGESVTMNRRKKVKDGPDTIDVVLFDKQEWDYANERIAAYSGSKQANLNLVILKNRAGLVKEQEWGAAALTGIGAALIAAFILAAWITRPVRKFTAATEEISRGGGDLTQRIEITSNDELGDLAKNLNRLFEHLHTLARDVQGASFQVGASSAEISAASKQMLEGAKDQAVKIEGSTAAVTELSTSIQQVASNAIEATKVAKQSNEAVGAAIRSMNQIRQTVEEAAEKIQDLGESGKRIGNIVEVIRQISEQTSLLALNASIEAAHAGEQGRGFAVVADEVSSLAKRVGQSAKDIEDLIATIKDQTADAVRVMQTGTSEVESGTEKVTSTLENLKHIIDVVQDTATAVQEQALVSDEIARNMDAVQKIAGEVVSSSEEAVIQGEQLHKLAVRLEQSVRGFNLDGGGAAAAASPPPAPPAAESTPMLPLPRAREARPRG